MKVLFKNEKNIFFFHHCLQKCLQLLAETFIKVDNLSIPNFCPFLFKSPTFSYIHFVLSFDIFPQFQQEQQLFRSRSHNVDLSKISSKRSIAIQSMLIYQLRYYIFLVLSRILIKALNHFDCSVDGPYSPLMFLSNRCRIAESIEMKWNIGNKWATHAVALH